MLAISIRDDKMLCAQATVAGESIVLEHIDGFPLPRSLKPGDFRSSAIADRFHTLLRRAVDRLQIPEREFFLSLSDEWIETRLVNMDATLSKAEKEEYLNWAWGQSLGEIWEETLIFFQEMADGQDTTERVLVCTARRAVVEGIRAAVDQAGAIPVWMEPSVLSVSRVVTYLDKGKTTKTMSLEPAKRYFKAVFHSGGQLRALAKLRLRSHQATVIFECGDTDLIACCLAELNAFLSGQEDNPDLHVYLVGVFSPKTLDAIGEQVLQTPLITIVNPFSSLESDKIQVPDCTRGSWYVDILGLIQKGVGHA